MNFCRLPRDVLLTERGVLAGGHRWHMDETVARLESLYREHGEALLRYLRRRGGGAPAEDLLQETFVQALRAVDRLAAAASPRAWLFAIARNVAATAWRRHRPTAPLPADVPTREAPTDPRIERMRQAIAGLPDGHREVIELRLAHDLSYEEIAETLGIPLGTVRSRLHHAMARLRRSVDTDRE